MITIQTRQPKTKRFDKKVALTLGDMRPYKPSVPTIGDKPVGQYLHDKGKAAWDRMVEKGKGLMLQVTRALGRHDVAAALAAMRSDRAAFTAYLTAEKAKRERWRNPSSSSSRPPAGTSFPQNTTRRACSPSV